MSVKKSFKLRVTGCTYLVGSLVELLGVERTTEAEGDTLTEEDVVGEGSNTAVVDLGLEISCEHR